VCSFRVGSSPLASAGVGVSFACYRLMSSPNSTLSPAVFYLVAIIVTPFSILSFFFLPKHSISVSNKDRKLDWQGVLALAGGLILFVYAISEGNDVG